MRLLQLFAILILSTVVTRNMWAQGDQAPTVKDRKIKSEHFKKSEAARAFSELTPDDQKKVREALRTVWTDPKVLSSRENVRKSTNEYLAAIRESITRQDPETVKILDKIQKSNSGILTNLGMPMGSRKRPYPGGFHNNRMDHILASPAMLEGMTDEQKRRFKEASIEAKQRSDVNAALQAFKNLSKEDEQMRNRKTEAIRSFRKTYFDAIVELAPELREVIPPPGSLGAPPNHGGKGKGMRKRPQAPPTSEKPPK